jgi:5-methylcytosine-specific restriction enzyme A
MHSRVERKRGRAAVELRRRRLDRTNGLCEMCLPNRATLATVVDHIIPLAHGGSDDDGNTRNLCRAHDLEATAKQFGQKAPKQTIGADGWPV